MNPRYYISIEALRTQKRPDANDRAELALAVLRARGAIPHTTHAPNARSHDKPWCGHPPSTIVIENKGEPNEITWCKACRP